MVSNSKNGGMKVEKVSGVGTWCFFPKHLAMGPCSCSISLKGTLFLRFIALIFLNFWNKFRGGYLIPLCKLSLPCVHLWMQGRNLPVLQKEDYFLFSIFYFYWQIQNQILSLKCSPELNRLSDVGFKLKKKFNYANKVSPKDYSIIPGIFSLLCSSERTNE